MKINGVCYFWRMSHLSQRTIAMATGLSVNTFRTMCKIGKEETTLASSLLAISQAYAVPVEELLRPHDDSELDPVKGTAFQVTDAPINCVEVYRRRHCLTYQMLSLLLGCEHRQSAYDCCKRLEPRPKHVRILAADEGITPAQFMIKYSPAYWRPEDDLLFSAS